MHQAFWLQGTAAWRCTRHCTAIPPDTVMGATLPVQHDCMPSCMQLLHDFHVSSIEMKSNNDVKAFLHPQFPCSGVPCCLHGSLMRAASELCL